MGVATIHLLPLPKEHCVYTETVSHHSEADSSLEQNICVLYETHKSIAGFYMLKTARARTWLLQHTPSCSFTIYLMKTHTTLIYSSVSLF